jgi:hypothetical protein
MYYYPTFYGCFLVYFPKKCLGKSTLFCKAFGHIINFIFIEGDIMGKAANQAEYILERDARWMPFCERYACRLELFMFEVLGMNPTSQQSEIAAEIEVYGSRTSVASGHGTGKTRLIGAMCLWHLLCFPKSNTILTAPKLKQLSVQVWQEIVNCKAMMMAGDFEWLAKQIEIKAETVYILNRKETWFITAKTAPKGSPENLAGSHNDWLFIIVDEASGVDTQALGVLLGALSSKNNRMAMFSQPTRSSGYFYDSHHGNSKYNGGNWTAIVLNSEESSIVSTESILQWQKEYGGRDSPTYGIKVLGRFPDKTDGMLLGLAESRLCFDRSTIQDSESYGLVYSVDVGGGNYRDDSVMVLAKVSGHGQFYDNSPRRVEVIDVPILSNAYNAVDFAGQIYQEWLKNPSAVVAIDIGGEGKPVATILENKGVTIIPVRWGDPCHNKKLKENYGNQRAHCTSAAAQAVRLGFLGIKKGHWTAKLETQMSRIPFFYDEKARIQIERKANMKSAGIPSPDIFDTICQLFLEDVYYNAYFTQNEQDNVNGVSKASLLAAAANYEF